AWEDPAKNIDTVEKSMDKAKNSFERLIEAIAKGSNGLSPVKDSFNSLAQEIDKIAKDPEAIGAINSFIAVVVRELGKFAKDVKGFFVDTKNQWDAFVADYNNSDLKGQWDMFQGEIQPFLDFLNNTASPLVKSFFDKFKEGTPPLNWSETKSS